MKSLILPRWSYVLWVVLLLLGPAAPGQVPNLLNYQGRVVVGTTNFDGSGLFKFALVNGDGTTTFWSNDGTSTAGSQPTAAVTLAVAKGLYSVQLGNTALANMTAIPQSVFANSDVRLRIWFNDGTNGFQLLTPDQRFVAVGYAMMAASVPDGSITAAKLSSNLTLGGTTSGTFSGPVTGDVTGNVTGTAANFTGALAGDVTGTQAATVVASVGASSAANVHAATLAANGATSANTPNTIVKRDGSGNFAAGVITASSLTGNVTGNVSGTASGFTGNLAGDVTGPQGATVVAFVGTSSAANVNAAELAANGATSANTANTIVKRDANGNFSAGTITLAGGLSLPSTTGAGVGVVTQNGVRLLHSFGTNNFFAGPNAGNLTNTGQTSTGVGVSALASLTSGVRLTAVGFNALVNNTSGHSSTAVGYQSLAANTSGTLNTACGYQALFSNSSASSNTAVGWSALTENTTGPRNTAVGRSALQNNTTGTENVAVGANASLANTTGGFNTATGFAALEDNLIGSFNTANGYAALANSTADFNSAFGYAALQSNTTGESNTAIGYTALQDNTTGIQNTANGHAALSNTTTGSVNTAVGNNALKWNTTGGANTAVGAFALEDNTIGVNNTSVGQVALRDNISGNSNTAIGHNVLRDNSTGNNNTAVGAGALILSTGSGNIAIGAGAGDVLITENDNIVIGHPGVPGESNTVRIGTDGTHADVHIAGVIHGDGSGLTGAVAQVDRQSAAVPGIVTENNEVYMDLISLTTHNLGGPGNYLINFRTTVNFSQTDGADFILNIGGTDVTAYKVTGFRDEQISITYVAQNVPAGTVIKARFKNNTPLQQTDVKETQISIDGVPQSYVR